MVLTWSPPVSADFWDAYLDWSWLLQERRAALAPPPARSPVWFTPVFVRLKPSGTPPRIETTRQAVLDQVDTPLDPLLMDPQEYDRLAARAAQPPTATGLPDEYALYLRHGTPRDAYASLMDVIDMGYPVNLDADQTPRTLSVDDTRDADTSSAAKGHPPIVAIIDDGIGFLNARFRKPTGAGKYRTRFHAVWLQALETRPRGPGPRRAHIGEIYSRKDINTWLARGDALEEAAVYSALNQQLYGTEEHRALEFGRSHGTHVLDLAAGADPEATGDPVHRWPLLGVQLPPEAVSDTSGMRFESYMVQAVRWVLSQSALIDKKAPVIINLSLGMLAGPKDGSSFAEYQIAREAAVWEQVTGQPVRVVWAFGNNRRSRQVA
ncbi:S8 family serine peptidase, partial [Puniceibacterium confluentis]|uniref:S8 family serine peptidase n=1 Tax=Puniceibacterium confluentis TaxID=1958944 RepID=UPI003569E5F5